MQELLAVVEEQRQHAGAPPDVTLFLGAIAVWLGHSSTKLTLDTYGHLMGAAAAERAGDGVQGLSVDFSASA